MSKAILCSDVYIPEQELPERAVDDRFWSKVKKGDDDGCWIWTACIEKLGYGAFKINGKNRKAHRLAYTCLVGPIPDGLELDHLCRNRACCNPKHLEPVPHKVNTQRGEEATKTHCHRGHLLSGSNLYVYKGRRNCRACKKINALEFQQRKNDG